jgi:hypothetical protein
LPQPWAISSASSSGPVSAQASSERQAVSVLLHLNGEMHSLRGSHHKIHLMALATLCKLTVQTSSCIKPRLAHREGRDFLDPSPPFASPRRAGGAATAHMSGEGKNIYYRYPCGVLRPSQAPPTLTELGHSLNRWREPKQDLEHGSHGLGEDGARSKFPVHI